MKRIEYNWIDKSEWDRGPWDSEPDKVQWQDEATGLPCLIRRNDLMGNWCGYVGVSDSHPWFALDYTKDAVDIRVHGGLTFSDFCTEDEKEHGICHVPAPGEPDHVWWFGFDCNHGYDLAPGMVATMKKVGCKPWPLDVYRDLQYVQRECADLAQQLAGSGLRRGS